MAGYFYQRGRDKAGPFTLDEMAAFLREGRLRESDPVTREGEDQWRPARSVPELVAAARQPLPTELMPRKEKRFRRQVLGLPTRQELERRPAPPAQPLRKGPFAPGRPPALPGIYVRYAHPFPELPALLDDAGSRWEAIESARGRVRWSLVATLVALVVLAPQIDLAAGFGARVFSRLVPFFLAGVALVLLATRRGGFHRRGAWEAARQFGCFALFLVPFAVLALGLLLLLSREHPVATFAILAAGGFAAVWIARRQARTGATEPLWRRRLREVAMALETLRDEVAPGKPALGWLDLTGPEQHPKLASVRRASSGATVEVYRDDWWSFSAPLRDGNRVRITASDRFKVKRGRWRSRGARQKWKSGARRSLSSVDLRLRVNTAAYRVLEGPVPPEVTISGDTMNAALDGSRGLQAKDLVRALSSFYARLEPLAARLGG